MLTFNDPLDLADGAIRSINIDQTCWTQLYCMWRPAYICARLLMSLYGLFRLPYIFTSRWCKTLRREKSNEAKKKKDFQEKYIRLYSLRRGLFAIKLQMIVQISLIKPCVIYIAPLLLLGRFNEQQTPARQSCCNHRILSGSNDWQDHRLHL